MFSLFCVHVIFSYQFLPQIDFTSAQVCICCCRFILFSFGLSISYWTCFFRYTVRFYRFFSMSFFFFDFFSLYLFDFESHPAHAFIVWWNFPYGPFIYVSEFGFVIIPIFFFRWSELGERLDGSIASKIRLGISLSIELFFYFRDSIVMKFFTSFNPIPWPVLSIHVCVLSSSEWNSYAHVCGKIFNLLRILRELNFFF